MTDESDSEDIGMPFIVVRMQLPSAEDIQMLPTEVREKARANMDRARRVFRSQTLPIPGSSDRLYAGFCWDLATEVDSAIFDGISDKRSRSVLACPPKPNGDATSRVEMLWAGNKSEPRLVIHSAKELLGKYWYRHQEMDIFDAKKMIDEMEAARARGESWANIGPWTKPPAPPRRHK